MKSIFVALMCLLLSTSVLAGYYNGKVSTLIVDKNPVYNNGIGVVHIRTSELHVDKPAGCHSGYFVVSLGDEHGRGVLAAALTAKASGRDVKIVGTGVCGDTWVSSESIKWIYLK